MMTRAVDQLCVNTIRTPAIDTVQEANCGQSGTPMALAPAAYRAESRTIPRSVRCNDFRGRVRWQ